MRFKVGDVVVLVALRSREEVERNGYRYVEGQVGQEAIIIGPAHSHTSDWLIECGDGLRGEVQESQLAPKRPPAFERGSWDEIKRVTGWSPKVVA